MRNSHPILAMAACAAFPAIALAAGPLRTVTVSEGTNVNLTLSPDRKTIIMDLQQTLWSLPAAGGLAKRLTDTFLEAAQPNWSPRGDLVAFQSFKTGTFHIWLMKPDGTGLRQLTDGHGDDREPRFSPDGAQIAFSSDRAFQGNYDIWVVDVATGKLTQWTSDPDDEFQPAWSPDGTQIAFVRGTGTNGRTIESIDASGVRKTLVTAGAAARLESPSWSPDGRLAYAQFSGRTTRLMVSGQPVGSATDVFPFPAVWLSSNQLLYTGDGKILVSAIGGETNTIPFRATFTLDRPPYQQRQVDFDSSASRPVKGIVEPALSPDGRRVVFEALNQIWLMDIGGRPQPLTHDSYYKHSPAWSPDGAKIAYSSDEPGTAEIYVFDLASRTARRVTRSTGSGAFAPAWSPDGARIAFQNQRGATSILNLSTGEIQDAAPGSNHPGKPSWSKNGNALSMAVLRSYSRRFREGTNVIETVDLTTHKVTLTEPAPFRSIATRGADGPIYSPAGSEMAFVMGGYLWTLPVDANGIPAGPARQLNHEATDNPTWSGDGRTLLYLSNGKLRLIAADGSNPPRDMPLDFTWHRPPQDKTTIIHAGRLWDGLGPQERTNVDIVIVGRRIRAVQPHRYAAPAGAEIIDAPNLTVIPGLWDAHVHYYGGLPDAGDRQGRMWLAYGFTDLQSQGDGAYEQMENKESFASGVRVGPRYFATGEIIEGERQYYWLHHSVISEAELRAELERARALEYDNLKTYVRLPLKFQQEVMTFAHQQLGTWTASHYGMPGMAFGMDQISHVSATTRWGYSYTRSAGGVVYADVRSLFEASGMVLESTPFTATALYADYPGILDDPRFTALVNPWERQSATASRDRVLHEDRTVQLENLRAEEDALIESMHKGVLVPLGSDNGFPVFNHLALRGEVKFGMQPWEALQTATLFPAKAFGYGKDLGSIEPGKLADLVIVAGDPLRDIQDAANVQKVIVDGRVYSISDLTAPFAGK